MNGFVQKNQKALIKGGIISIFLAIVLIGTRLVIFDSANIVISLLAFVFCWIVLSFLIQKFRVYKVLAVLGLLVVMFVIPHYTGIWDNPITVPLLILFWLGVTYLVLPEFFKKYRAAIFSVYGLVIVYHFFFFNTVPDDAQNYRLNLVNFMLLPIPVFAGLWLYEQWRWVKTIKADKTKAELALLKSQVNPHFFFNTLNNLYGLVVEKSPQAPEMVLKLSDMMRYTIYEGKEDLVNLTDEINYLETYIKLHEIRYRKKVDIQFVHDVDEMIQVAPMLFIVLLENAIKHGVEPLAENAYIHMNLSTENDRLLFGIVNNYEAKASGQKAGIGLDNLKKRLGHYYPDRHELKIEKTDSIYSARLELWLNP